MTLLNRGNLQDGLGNQVRRIQCDRSNEQQFVEKTQGLSWDVVYDQVCYDYPTAKMACELFRGRVGHYVFTSSKSVYQAGANLSEEAYVAENHAFEALETKDSNYAEAKRQAEVGFVRHADFPLTCVRFPIVIGPDDYTERFLFHCDHLYKQKPIYFPSLKAKISFISSNYAAQSLVALANMPDQGALNIARPACMPIQDLLDILENSFRKSFVFANEASEESHSPYGIDRDWYVSCEKWHKLTGRPAEDSPYDSIALLASELAKTFYKLN